MPISTATLKAKIIAELQAQFGAPDDATIQAKFAEAIAKAVKDEIAANAQVVGTVTTGAGAGGAVTGTVS